MCSVLEECDHTIGAFHTQLEQERATAASQISLLTEKVESLMSELDELNVQLHAICHHDWQVSWSLWSTQNMLQDSQKQNKHLSSWVSTLSADQKCLDSHLHHAHTKISNSAPAKLQVKVGGIIADKVHCAIMDLYSLNIGASNILVAIQIVTDLLGVRLVGSFSPSSVLRIVGEGGVAADIQIIKAALDASSEQPYCVALVLLLTHCKLFHVAVTQHPVKDLTTWLTSSLGNHQAVDQWIS